MFEVCIVLFLLAAKNDRCGSGEISHSLHSLISQSLGTTFISHNFVLSSEIKEVHVSLVCLFALEKEAEALVKLLQEFPTAKAWVSFSCKASG